MHKWIKRWIYTSYVFSLAILATGKQNKMYKLYSYENISQSGRELRHWSIQSKTNIKNILIILYKIVITLKEENAQTFFYLLESKVSVSFPLAYHIQIKIFFFLSLFIFLRNLVTLKFFVIFLHIFEPLPVPLCLHLLIQGSFPKRHLPNNQVYGILHSSLVFLTLALLILFHSTYHHFKKYCLFIC